jgi:predicted Zn-dependent peptidase
VAARLPPDKTQGTPARRTPSEFSTARLEAFDAAWRLKVLPNGMTAVHVPTEGDQFYIGVTIRAGSRAESPDLTGIAHFLEHMMFRGSRKYPEFTALAEAFEWLGGEWNAATGYDHTEYWYSGIRHTAAESIELFAEFMTHPAFGNIEVERHIIQRELDGEMNDHGHSTDLDYHIAMQLWPGSPVARPILGSPETLEKIQVEALRAHRDRLYTPPNMAVCVVSADDSDVILALLERAFGNYRAESAEAVTNAYIPFATKPGPHAKWIEHSDNEYEIQLSFATDGQWSDDAPALEILARIMSDGFCARLTRRLREELGLVYDVSCQENLGIDHGSIDINAACSQEQLDEFLRELTALLHQFAKQGPNTDEVERAKLRTIVGLELSAGRPDEIAPRLCWSHLCGRPFSLMKEREKLLAVTTADVARVAKQVLRQERAALAVLGPQSDNIEVRIKKALTSGLPK